MKLAQSIETKTFKGDRNISVRELEGALGALVGALAELGRVKSSGKIHIHDSVTTVEVTVKGGTLSEEERKSLSAIRRLQKDEG